MVKSQDRKCINPPPIKKLLLEDIELIRRHSLNRMQKEIDRIKMPRGIHHQPPPLEPRLILHLPRRTNQSPRLPLPAISHDKLGEGFEPINSPEDRVRQQIARGLGDRQIITLINPKIELLGGIQ